MIGWIIDIARGAIDYLVNSVMYWVFRIGKAIVNAFISVYNWIIGGLEWLYNSMRPHLVKVLTLWFTFFGEKRIIHSDTASLKKKIVGVFATPILSYLASEIICSFLPMEISLPRIEPLPEDIEYDGSGIHEPLVIDSTAVYPRIIEDYGHVQDEIEDVYIYKRIFEETYHDQLLYEYVDIHYKMLEVYETLIQSYQVIQESVIIMYTVVFSEYYTHDQVVEEAVTIQ